MTMADKKLAPELTALRCVFLVAMHYGLQLAPDELPQFGHADMVPAVLRALKEAGLKGQALRQAWWAKAAALGTAYPALAVRRDGS